MRSLLSVFVLLCVAGCGSSSSTSPTTSTTSTTTSTATPSPTAVPTSSGTCGHRVDPTIVSFGENEVRNDTGAAVAPTGSPIQEGWTLARSAATVTDHNSREYARIASYQMPIRDALMCDIATTTLEQWKTLTTILTINNIKLVQDLSGTPTQQVYSTDGIYEHLRNDGADDNAMLKYLEESELELKCLAFVDFDFTNPEGENHCVIHNLAQGSGLSLP